MPVISWRNVAVVVLALGCAPTMRFDTVGEAPILAASLLPDRLGETVCSVNNQPVVRLDTAVLASADAEIVNVHEQTHASRMRAYRGGCWPYLYRYTKDRRFRVREELAAYCAKGRFAIARNRYPVAAWERIVRAMASDTVLIDRDNCLYEPVPP